MSSVVQVRPTGDVSEWVVARVEAESVADDESDRFNLDLAARLDAATMQQRVGELVDQCLDGLGWHYVGKNGDALGAKRNCRATDWC